MRTNSSPRVVAPFLLSFALACCCLTKPASASDAYAFGYAGQLLVGGVGVTGTYDFEFSLYNALTGGTQVGSNFIESSVPVSSGSYYITLNFGPNIFTGTTYYLQTAYAVSPSTTYTTLPARIVVPSSAVSQYSNLSRNTQGLQGYYVSLTPPIDGQVLTYSAANKYWYPAAGTPGPQGPAGPKGATGATGPQGAPGTTYTPGGGLTLSGNALSIAAGGVTGADIALPLDLTGSTTATNGVVSVTDTSNGYAIVGTSAGNAIEGNSPSGGQGILGEANGIGVFGIASGQSSSTYGVEGYSVGTGWGVYGKALSGVGVHGINSSGSYGELALTNGYGVYGSGTGNAGGYFTSSNYDGVDSFSVKHTAVYGNNTGIGNYGTLGDVNGYGVYAVSSATDGIYGTSSSNSSAGVYGNNSGNGYGVYGSSATGTGVWGQSSSATSPGVFGTNAQGGYGDLGYAQLFSGNLYDTTGVFAVASNANNNELSFGIWALSPTSGGTAGYFEGNVGVTGSVSSNVIKSTIDDPLDPTNKYLNHVAIVSDEMLNQYSGNVTTDARGSATVTLPKWFGEMNTDFRYQLTCIGQFAQAIVAQEVKDNQFSIATDKPSVKVSWQITGVRNDPSALTHQLEVEEDKPSAARGSYLDPQAYGQPLSDRQYYDRELRARQLTTKNPAQ